MSDLTEFLLARIAEDEQAARDASPAPWQFGGVDSVAGGMVYDKSRRIVDVTYEQPDVHDSTIVRPLLSEEADANGRHIARHDPARVLRECEAKREIVEAHRKWPVLITTPPKLETSDSADTMSVTMRMTQQIEWRTQEEYRTKFGDEPPTAPMIRALAMIYQDHPDFRDEWR